MHICYWLLLLLLLLPAVTAAGRAVPSQQLCAGGECHGGHAAAFQSGRQPHPAPRHHVRPLARLQVGIKICAPATQQQPPVVCSILPVLKHPVRFCFLLVVMTGKVTVHHASSNHTCTPQTVVASQW